MRIAVTGAGGMLGQALAAALAEHETLLLRHADADITRRDALARALAPFAPRVVINCAAATHVDRCETAPDWAYAVNRDGAENVALACAALGARLIHLSTDFVFRGDAAEPYPEDAPTDPINVYGASKLAGEEAVLAALPGALVVRTQWLYGPGGANFALTMLRLAAHAGDEGLRVVMDQTGAPTYTPHLARQLGSLAERDLAGVLHLTNAGQATRHEWVMELLRLAGWGDVAVQPVGSDAFSTPARRPAYSVLRCARWAALGAADMPPWQQGVAEYIDTLERDPEATALLGPER